MTDKGKKSVKKATKGKIDYKDWLKKKGSGVFLNIIRYALILCIGYVILLPILEMISTAVMSPEEVGSPVSEWVPSEFSLEHLIVAFKLLHYPSGIGYTLLTTALQVVLQVLSAAITGYVFARVRSKKIQALFIIVILTIIVPQSVILLPQYLFFRNFDIFGIFELLTGSSMNLLGKPIVLYILDFCGMGLKAGLYIYIFRQFFRGLPYSLEEAAYVDGSGFIRTLFTIALPNAMPGIITVTVLSFVWNWNDTFYTNRFVGTDTNLMVRLNKVSGAMDNMLQAIGGQIPDSYYFDYTDPLYQASVLSSASLLVIFPLLILYSFIQKKFVESASSSGLGGT